MKWVNHTQGVYKATQDLRVQAMLQVLLRLKKHRVVPSLISFQSMKLCAKIKRLFTRKVLLLEGAHRGS